MYKFLTGYRRVHFNFSDLAKHISFKACSEKVFFAALIIFAGINFKWFAMERYEQLQNCQPLQTLQSVRYCKPFMTEPAFTCKQFIHVLSKSQSHFMKNEEHFMYIYFTIPGSDDKVCVKLACGQNSVILLPLKYKL